jgi:hypothetical protein
MYYKSKFCDTLYVSADIRFYLFSKFFPPFEMDLLSGFYVILVYAGEEKIRWKLLHMLFAYIHTHITCMHTKYVLESFYCLFCLAFVCGIGCVSPSANCMELAAIRRPDAIVWFVWESIT